MQSVQNQNIEQLKWYAVRTKPRHEKKVSTYFEQKNISCYCPLRRTQKQWSDRKKWVDEVLIPCFVFVNVTEEQQVDVLQTPGVINFLYWLKKPAVVKNKDIETLKRFLNDYSAYELVSEDQNIDVNDTIEIINGALIGMKGIVETVQGKIAQISLPLLSKTIKFKLPVSHLNKVPI